jgi:hypothetical protein
MSSLWLPPQVSRELRQSTLEYQAEVFAHARQSAFLDYWTRELKKIDPRLEMIKANDDATVVGLIPGYYHVMLVLADGPPSLLPIMGDHGEFVEPTSRILDRLREGDLQNPEAMRARRERDERAAAQRKRDAERDAEDRVAQMVDHYKSFTETRVSLSKAAPWSQSVNGRRGTRAA